MVSRLTVAAAVDAAAALGSSDPRLRPHRQTLAAAQRWPCSMAPLACETLFVGYLRVWRGRSVQGCRHKETLGDTATERLFET